MNTMNKKPVTLDRRIAASLCSKCILILFLLLLCVPSFSERLPGCVREATVPAVLLLFGLMLFLDFRFLFLPYRELVRQQQLLLSSDTLPDLNFLTCFFTAEDRALVREMEEFIRQEKDADQDRKQSEYLALQNQINPHFLYNTLDAIRSDAMKAGAWEIADLIESLSSFFAYTISNMDTYASVREELSHVREYYLIQKYRFKDRINLEIRNDEEIDLEGLYVPRLLLQPLVENAISHGLEVQTRQGTVTISFSETEKDLLIHVADNGAGMNEETLQALNASLDQYIDQVERPRKKRGGIALVNVNHRIRILSGPEYGLHVYSVLNAGTVVTARLPKIDREHADEKRISSN